MRKEEKKQIFSLTLEPFSKSRLTFEVGQRFIYIYYIFIQAGRWPPQEKLFIWPLFFQYIKRLLRQKMGGACLYMPQDGHWLASFEVIPPPKKLVFPRPKNENSPLKLFS